MFRPIARRAVNGILVAVVWIGAVGVVGVVGSGAAAAPPPPPPAPESATEPEPEAEAALPRVEVRLTDGRRFEGELLRDVPSHVMLKIAGLPTRIDRVDVERVVALPSDREVFALRRLELADDDLVGRLHLAQEMFSADALTVAKTELTSLDRAFPEVPAVRRLLAAVDARQALRANAGSGGKARADDAVTARTRTPRPAYLSEAEQALVRVYEIDLNGRQRPRVTVPARVMEAALVEYAGHPAAPSTAQGRRALLTAPGQDQLSMLFTLEAREVYGEVEVHDDPASLLAFRREINPQHVARYFEPFFGEGRIDGLNLVRWRPTTKAEAYTNFVALNRFGRDGALMIDRFAPDDSLLLQWALPRDEARYPAPDVPGWKPRFKSTTDLRYLAVRDWIDGLVKFAPDYATVLPEPVAEGDEETPPDGPQSDPAAGAPTDARPVAR